MKWTTPLLFCTIICSGEAAAGTVTGVRASVPSVAAGTAFSVTVSGTNPCGAAHVNYGDGTAITYAITGLPSTHSHKYERPGTYAIVARGMGNCDGEATTRIQVTGPPVPPPPPPPAASEITGVTFEPRRGVVRQPVTIGVTGRGPCAFSVNFGDGNVQEVSGTLPQRVNHTYAVAQTYTVIVAPVAPCTGRFTERLQIAARAESNRITRLTIDPEPATIGGGVTIGVEGTGTCTYRIDYGDGNTEDRSKPLPDRMRHVYNAAGTYQVVAVGTGGCQGRARRALDVR